MGSHPALRQLQCQSLITHRIVAPDNALFLAAQRLAQDLAISSNESLLGNRCRFGKASIVRGQIDLAHPACVPPSVYNARTAVLGRRSVAFSA